MLNIAQGLQAQKAISAEIAHRRDLENRHAWSYRSYDHPDAEMKANFDFEENHKEIMRLSKLHTKIGQAISRTNLLVELDQAGLTEEDLNQLSVWV